MTKADATGSPLPARVRAGAKRAAFASGLLSRYHRARNPYTLTVTTFHRVLEEHDERWAYADPRYTVSTHLFDECIAFFERHYDVVDGETVAAAVRGEAALPRHGLLVTLDDGWADTAEYALPVLRRRG